MIREATEGDVPHILQMGRKFYEASHWAALAPYSPPRVEAMLRHLIVSPDAAVFVTAQGVLGVIAAPLWCGEALTVQELFFWASDGRGSALRRAAEAWAASKGAAAVLMGAHEPGDIERVGRWYARAGYEPHGRFYKKVMRNGD